MKASDEAAIAKFLEAGGRISIVKETKEVGEQELLRFLAERGIRVRRRLHKILLPHNCWTKERKLNPSGLHTRSRNSAAALPYAAYGK
jgi:hypothetical protein